LILLAFRNIPYLKVPKGQLFLYSIEKEKNICVTLDGYSSELDSSLIQYLENAIETEEPKGFYFGCFKMLTRNVEKLLSVRC